MKPYSYIKSVNEVKERFNEHMRDMVLSCHSGSNAFWILAKQVNNNLIDSFLPTLIPGDVSIITSSKEKPEVFART